MGQLCDHIGRGRSHQHHIRQLCQGNVLHGKLKIPVKGVHQALVPGQRLKGNGIDEIGGVFCHDHMDVGP